MSGLRGIERRVCASRVECLAGLIAVALAAACGDKVAITQPVDAGSGNTVFPGTAPIGVLAPTSGCTVIQQPTFAWTQTGHALVFAGVFNANISVSNGRITSGEANVWAWQSGSGLGREGNVPYADGAHVTHGVLDTIGISPPPLAVGNYVWAVWAWDDSGLSVTNSSAETFFRVDTVNIGCPAQRVVGPIGPLQPTLEATKLTLSDAVDRNGLRSPDGSESAARPFNRW